VSRRDDRLTRLEAKVSAIGKARAEGLDPSAQARQPRPKTTQEFAEAFRHFRLGTPWFHKAWYEAMDDPSLLRVFIMGPRLHAKTSCVLTYALRRLCEDHNLRIGIISQTDQLAKHFLAEIKYELETNEALLQRYGPGGGRPFKGSTWTEHRIVLSDAHEGPRGISGKDVSVFSVGRGGQITGYHCDLLIVDDLETKEATDSPAVRQGTREWWSREVEPVLAPGGKLIGTGTRKISHGPTARRLVPVAGSARRLDQCDVSPLRDRPLDVLSCAPPDGGRAPAPTPGRRRADRPTQDNAGASPGVLDRDQSRARQSARS